MLHHPCDLVHNDDCIRIWALLVITTDGSVDCDV